MSNKFNFNKSKLASIISQESRVRYYDLKVSGLILDVLPTGRKSFRVYKKIKGNPVPINVTLGAFPDLTIEQARKLAHNKLNQMAEQINPNLVAKEEQKKQVILANVYSDYQRDRALKPKTLRGYNQVINCYFSDWKNLSIHLITEEMISTCHRDVTKKSPAQADLAMRFLKALFNYAKHEYKTAKSEPIFILNPVEILNHKRQWNNVGRKNTRLKQKELKPWFDAVFEVQNDPVFKDNIDHNICMFLQMTILTGLRMEELLELKWEYIDFEEKLFFLPDTDTKNGLYFELPLSDYLFKILSEHRATSPDYEEYVFYTDNGYGYIREPKKIIKKIVDKSGITFTHHDLRRTFASIAESLGLGTSYTLKRLLNHKTGRNDVTAGYTILTAEELREPAQKIENKILELAGIKEVQSKIQNDLWTLFENLSQQQQTELVAQLSISNSNKA